MEITPNDDRIDSRDVVARIAELEEEATDDEGEIHLGVLGPDELEELGSLRALLHEIADFGDPDDGVYLISESSFAEYAQELAEEIGAIPDNNHTWPTYCIDWEWAARELAHDYSMVKWGETYYYTREA